MKNKTTEEPMGMQLQAAAKRLNISPSTLRRRIYAKQIAAVKIGTRYVIRTAELDRVLREGAR